MEIGKKFSDRIKKYDEDYRVYGYDPKAMAMPSDRRNIRYHELIKHFDFYQHPDSYFTILDAGCGFADLNHYLKYCGCQDYQYIGLEIVPSFVKFAKEKYKDNTNICIIERDFIQKSINDLEFDYAVMSQTFNDCYSEEPDNLQLLKETVEKLYLQCKKGIAFNFVTDKIQYKKEGVAYHSPEKILSFAYTFTNAVFMDNGCMPYECTCTMLKDKASDRMIFDLYKRKYERQFKDKIFIVKDKK